MLKTKFFKAAHMCELEREVNDFIRDKAVVNISYSVVLCSHSLGHCCCVLYNTLG